MPHKLKVVFDTNIYISAIIFGGSPDICLDIARGGQIELYTSKTALLELANKLRDKFYYSEEDVEEVLIALSGFIKIVAPVERVNEIKADPSDNRILEAAMEAKADFIVSGDKKHILSLKEFRSTKILSATEFLKEFYKP